MNKTANFQGKGIRLWLMAAGMALLLTGKAFGQANTWVTKASMPAPRGEIATGVINGILYVAGGVAVGPGLFSNRLVHRSVSSL